MPEVQTRGRTWAPVNSLFFVRHVHNLELTFRTTGGKTMHGMWSVRQKSDVNDVWLYEGSGMIPKREQYFTFLATAIEKLTVSIYLIISCPVSGIGILSINELTGNGPWLCRQADHPLCQYLYL